MLPRISKSGIPLAVRYGCVRLDVHQHRDITVLSYRSGLVHKDEQVTRLLWDHRVVESGQAVVRGGALDVVLVLWNVLRRQVEALNFRTKLVFIFCVLIELKAYLVGAHLFELLALDCNEGCAKLRPSILPVTCIAAVRMALSGPESLVHVDTHLPNAWSKLFLGIVALWD